MDETSSALDQRNEGEGNKAAAREYNQAQHRFVESGRVEEKAREAERAMDSPERVELERAEALGKSHRADEDSAAKSAQMLAQRARQQAAYAGDYLARNVNAYPFAAVLLAGLIGYGLGFLIHSQWRSQDRAS